MLLWIWFSYSHIFRVWKKKERKRNKRQRNEWNIYTQTNTPSTRKYALKYVLLQSYISMTWKWGHFKLILYPKISSTICVATNTNNWHYVLFFLFSMTRSIIHYICISSLLHRNESSGCFCSSSWNFISLEGTNMVKIVLYQIFLNEHLTFYVQ